MVVCSTWFLLLLEENVRFIAGFIRVGWQKIGREKKEKRRSGRVR